MAQANIPQSPQFPGIKAIAFFNPKAIPDASRILAGYGLILVIQDGITWVPLDGVAVLKHTSEIKDNSTISQTVLTFSSRDEIPPLSAFIAIAADDTAWAVGFQSDHPGSLKAESSTSDTKGDPVTVNYQFSSPYLPAKTKIQLKTDNAG